MGESRKEYILGSQSSLATLPEAMLGVTPMPRTVRLQHTRAQPVRPSMPNLVPPPPGSSDLFSKAGLFLLGSPPVLPVSSTGASFCLISATCELLLCSLGGWEVPKGRGGCQAGQVGAGTLGC